MQVTTTPGIEGKRIVRYCGIVGVNLDYEVLGEGNGMLMVSANGTAVVVE
jgi:uncharacterized protein YbjQ (UPF0145 family)